MLTLLVVGDEYYNEETQEFETRRRLRFRARAFSGLTVKMGVNSQQALSWLESENSRRDHVVH